MWCSCGMIMPMRYLRFSLRFFSQLKISAVKPDTMEKCYLRHENGHESFDLSFVYSNPELRVRRQFNFSRRTAETVEALQQRIVINVSKSIKRKCKKKSQSSEKYQPEQEVNVELFENGNNIEKNVLCQELLKSTDLKLKIVNQEYDVVINAPWILSISLHSSLLSGFPVYPVNFKTQFADQTKCIFTWFAGNSINQRGSKIADEHIQWEQIGTGYTCVPSTAVIGKKLKVECVPGDGYNTGPPVEAVSPGFVEAGPGRCPFEDRHAFTQDKLSGNSFRVVSYNILADLYCDSDYTRTVLHPYCPPYALHIDYRKQLIIKELIGYNADILCLQEVDKKIFEHELLPVLGAHEYEGVFMKKGKDVAEGLACFFRKHRFNLLSAKRMVFAERLRETACFKEIWDAIKDNEHLVQRVLNRCNAGVITVLESCDDNNNIIVAGNTHLYFHPDADHIRLIQGGLMIYWLNDVVKNIQAENPSKRVSVLMCGDFNSVPSCGIYKLYTTGVAPSDLADWKSNELEAVTGVALKQELALGSACGTPEFTNFTADFSGCLDYIYYDQKYMQVDQVIPLPVLDELKEHTALPSVVFPSDHIALVADLSFIKKQ